MIVIFGMIFNVDSGKGERFLDLEQIKIEIKDAQKAEEQSKESLEKIKALQEEMKQQKQEEFKCDDED